MQKTIVRVARRPTTHNTNHHFHDSDLSCTRAAVQTVPRLVFGLSIVFQMSLKRQKIHSRRLALEPPFIDNPDPIVMEADVDITTSSPTGAVLTEIRMFLETHRISNTSWPRFAKLFHCAKEGGLSLVPRPLNQLKFQCSSHLATTNLHRPDIQRLLNGHVCVFVGSHHHEPQKHHHLELEVTVVSVGQVPIELTRISAKNHRLNLGYCIRSWFPPP